MYLLDLALPAPAAGQFETIAPHLTRFLSSKDQNLLTSCATWLYFLNDMLFSSHCFMEINTTPVLNFPCLTVQGLVISPTLLPSKNSAYILETFDALSGVGRVWTIMLIHVPCRSLSQGGRKKIKYS